MDWTWVSEPQIWVSLFTLTLLEIVLGIDNIIFISILSGKLPGEQQKKARRVGLGAALITRVLLLCGLAWVVKLDKPFWSADILGLHVDLSGKALILLIGRCNAIRHLAIFPKEIHEKLEGEDGEVTNRIAPTFGSVIFQ